MMTVAELERTLTDLGCELRVVCVGRQWSAVLVRPGEEPVSAADYGLAAAVLKAVELTRAIERARRAVGA